MACGICGSDGHNARTCPQTLPTNPVQPNNNDYAFWFRYNGLTKEQAKKLKSNVEEAIEQIAPDSHGVIAVGKSSKLPERIQQAMNPTPSPKLDKPNKESK